MNERTYFESQLAGARLRWTIDEEPLRMSFICNREVRWIPRGWQHPQDPQGRYVPLHAADYLLRSSEDERAEIVASWRGRDLLMPAVQGRTEIAAYETTTEGTPISPAFPDTPEGRLALVSYCAAHATTFGSNKADAETWAAILFGGGALVSEDGSVEFA